MNVSDASAIEFNSVGDLIGQAVRLYWKNALMILQILIVPAIGGMIGKTCMYWPLVLFKVIGFLPSILLVLFGFLILLYSFWIMLLRQFALTKLFLGKKESETENNFASAYKAIRPLQGGVLAIVSLGAIASFAVLLTWGVVIIITAVLSKLHIFAESSIVISIAVEFLIMFLCVIMVNIIYWLAIIGLVLEQQSIKKTVADSWTFALHDFGRLLFFVILSFIVIFLLGPPLSLPFALLSIADSFMHGGQDFLSHLPQQISSFYGYKAPFYRMVLWQAWGSVLNMITWPIMCFSWGLFYIDLKKRLCGSDLFAKVEAKLTGGTSG